MRVAAALREEQRGAVARAGKARIVAHAGVFSAAYLAYGFVSSITFGPQFHGLDVHLARAFFMAVLAARLRVPGGPSLMGLISGLLLLGIPAPSAPFLLPASVLAGLSYDLWMRGGAYAQNVSRMGRIIGGSALGGVAESAVVTAGYSVFLPALLGTGFLVQLLTAGPLVGGTILLAWGVLLGANAALSAVGGALAAPFTRGQSARLGRGT
jgi:hypothetical protein